MPYGNKIVKRVDTNEFIGMIKEYSPEQIECTNHTFFRLSEKQRLIYTPEKLKEFLLHDEPFLAGLQNNRNYAVFYKHEKGKFMRMILDIQTMRKINIVSFYFIEQWQIPRI
jgi:hypothetical protein